MIRNRIHVLTSCAASDPPTPGAKHVSICTILCSPLSRGTTHAVSADPLAPPKIDPHYLEDDAGAQLNLAYAALFAKTFFC